MDIGGITVTQECVTWWNVPLVLKLRLMESLADKLVALGKQADFKNTNFGRLVAKLDTEVTEFRCIKK